MFHHIHWTSQKIASRLAEIQLFEYQERQALSPWRWMQISQTETHLPIEPIIDDSNWEIILPNSYWGKPRIDFVLRTNFNVPVTWAEGGDIALSLPIGIAGDFSHPEALIYIDGEPYAACDRHHQEVILPARWSDGRNHTLALHGWTGLGGFTVSDPEHKLYMGICEIVKIHQPTRDFIAAARVALGIADNLDEASTSRHHLYNALYNAFKELDLRFPIQDRFYQSVAKASEILHHGIDNAGPAQDVDITAIGHAHIDVAWLWTLYQTRQKVGRTFHNILRLMEKYPEFIYLQSQPQLYDYVRKDYPELFKEIKKRVASGRWEMIGGMWVEADCNLSGPESLARQFLLGRQFFKEHFGENSDSPVLWLPDVFGYAWNLPQLIKSAGLEYFFTIKIGWNQYNRLPYDSFWWQGLDGTRVLTHFSTTKDSGSEHSATYNANASPQQTLDTWLNFQQKDYGTPGETPPLLMSYGWGDGGGGPTREMIENIRLMGNFPASPKIHPGRVSDFFQRLEQAAGDRLPTWNGELYLEYHRGTYTTHAKIKRANRKAEFELHDSEFLATFASMLDHDYQYPFERFIHAWKLVCLNQFHDIITGTSIGPVYQKAHQQYEEIETIAYETREDAVELIRSHLGGDLIVINPTGFIRDDLAFWPSILPSDHGLTKNGTPIRTQRVGDGTLLEMGELPPYSIIPLKITAKELEIENNLIEVSTSKLENAYLKVEFNRAGDIIRILDKIANREVMPPNGIANQLQAFEDRPLSWDAWDIDIFYDEKMWLAEAAHQVKVIENGPIRGTLEIHRRILNSDYIQRVSLANNTTRLDFVTTINWNERRVLLKVAFPVNILSPAATYEIQWGNVERPTHRNTSWDWARFETAAQKWVDLSEGNYGVSLLNDCKYGHDIYENVIRLSLLRSTTAPDPTSDLGEHHFTYSLLPHQGNWKNGTISAAYAINDPLIVMDGDHQDSNPDSLSLVSCDANNVVIETIKLAEDGNGMIVRLYECKRERRTVSIKTLFPISSACTTNLLEENQETLDFSGKQLNFNIKPYQIITIRIVLENN